MISELLTKDDFREAIHKNRMIVITDKGGSPRIHPAGCDHIAFENFQEKVLINERRNGGYFAVESRTEAEEHWPGLANCYGWT